MIRAIQAPPFERIGIMDLEAFYPPKDRFQLAMRLNNLLAAPGFEAWLEGEPLNINRMLYTDQGRPRASIFSISHLSDTERMFFVAVLLNEILAWMRTQPGTTSLRAILYMDEIFGYFPPVKNPPSKAPLMTLLKQARAFGLGVVLSTQNPVDLDYKGLSNTGTWFIGRLQTDRDKARVLEGLEGAAAGTGFDRGSMEEILAGLGQRVFLLNNVSARPFWERSWAAKPSVSAPPAVSAPPCARPAVSAKSPWMSTVPGKPLKQPGFSWRNSTSVYRRTSSVLKLISSRMKRAFRRYSSNRKAAILPWISSVWSGCPTAGMPAAGWPRIGFE
jgi:hypothetical protein